MRTPKENRTPRRKQNSLPLTIQSRWHGALAVMMLASMVVLSSCGGSSSSTTNAGMSLSGNWQFAMNAPTDGSFSGGLQGGFLVQGKGSVAGQAVYLVSVASPPPTPCGGTASITGTLNGQTVALTAVAGQQSFQLTGSLSPDGKTITGTYSTIATTDCGTAQQGVPWSASAVPPLSGTVQGNIHSTGPPNIGQVNRDFAVTGSFAQGPNLGTSSAAVTGALNFQGYPCLDTASVTGQISGNSVILQIIATNGLNVGRIGSPPNSSTAPGPVSFQSSAGGGYILQGLGGYGIKSAPCPGFATSPGDEGNVCLGLANNASCAQPLLLTPGFLIFPGQPLGTAPIQQTIKLTNSGASGTLTGLQLSPTGNNFAPGDFTGLPSFAEQDNCSATPGSTFSLAANQSCTATLSFSPQQSCPWLPSASLGGTPPSHCAPFLPTSFTQVASPPVLDASLAVTCSGCPTGSDSDTTFLVPISGLGTSAIQPSTPELDFGAEDASSKEVSPPQSVSFTNQSVAPIQILPAVANPPCGSPGSQVLLPRPSVAGSVPGLQVVTGLLSLVPPTIQYVCDVDTASGQANFQIVPNSDTCSGTLLAPRQSCGLSIVYAPQPNESIGGLDYFLELNTLQCTSSTTTNCEIDSGRFPVELKAALASPLRLSPGAGLDFGTWPTGQISNPPLTVTLSNDKSVANPQNITILSKTTKGDYNETDNCSITLAPGGSCTLTIQFTPKVTGFDPGSITIAYNSGLIQVINLRGFGQ